LNSLDSGFRQNDKESQFWTFYEFVTFDKVVKNLFFDFSVIPANPGSESGLARLAQGLRPGAGAGIQYLQ
jgi:hypothetical protein